MPEGEEGEKAASASLEPRERQLLSEAAAQDPTLSVSEGSVSKQEEAVSEPVVKHPLADGPAPQSNPSGEAV